MTSNAIVPRSYAEQKRARCPARLAKVRRGKVDYDKDQLAADVDLAWHDYSEEKLARMWEYHHYCLQAAIDAKGGNMYPRHRPADMKAAEQGQVGPPRKRQRGVVPSGITRHIL